MTNKLETLTTKNKEDEKKLTENINNLNTMVENLNTQLKETTSKYESSCNENNKLNKQIETLNKTLESQQLQQKEASLEVKETEAVTEKETEKVTEAAEVLKLMPINCKYARATDVFEATNTKHLNVSNGDIIEILYSGRDGYFAGRNWLTKQDGYFPQSIVEPVGNDINDIENSIGSELFGQKINGDEEKSDVNMHNVLKSEIDRLESELDKINKNEKTNAGLINDLTTQLKEKHLEFAQVQAILESVKNDALTHKKQMGFMKKQKFSYIPRLRLSDL